MIVFFGEILVLFNCSNLQLDQLSFFLFLNRIQLKINSVQLEKIFNWSNWKLEQLNILHSNWFFYIILSLIIEF